jgi:2-C-methyl-D-erythritol 4-phosphate cytidylyltransferase
MGEYTNLKLTTPEDMNVAEEFLRQRAREQKVIEA